MDELTEEPRRLDESDIKAMLLNMHSTFLKKLKIVENKVDKLGTKYFQLEEKVENILTRVRESTVKVAYPNLSCTPMMTEVPGLISNSEDAYPEGSWLGDPDVADLRVRTSIAPLDLEYINNSCTSAQKMSLTLLDYLFDRETQARSNVSGTGMHGKDRLDPLKVYGIKCHLMYMFGIKNHDWLRIRQNIDSKCRTAFSRKKKGLSIKSKKYREQIPPEVGEFSMQPLEDLNSEVVDSQIMLEQPEIQEQIMIEQQPEIQDVPQLTENEINNSIAIADLPLDAQDSSSMDIYDSFESQVIRTEDGEFQVISATDEQIQWLKQKHCLEILSADDILLEPILQSSNDLPSLNGMIFDVADGD